MHFIFLFMVLRQGGDDQVFGTGGNLRMGMTVYGNLIKIRGNEQIIRRRPVRVVPLDQNNDAASAFEHNSLYFPFVTRFCPG